MYEQGCYMDNLLGMNKENRLYFPWYEWAYTNLQNKKQRTDCMIGKQLLSLPDPRDSDYKNHQITWK